MIRILQPALKTGMKPTMEDAKLCSIQIIFKIIICIKVCVPLI
jgi:hypothetical protein